MCLRLCELPLWFGRNFIDPYSEECNSELHRLSSGKYRKEINEHLKSYLVFSHIGLSIETHSFLEILTLVKFQHLNCFESLFKSLARQKDT